MRKILLTVVLMFLCFSYKAVYASGYAFIESVDVSGVNEFVENGGIFMVKLHHPVSYTDTGHASSQAIEKFNKKDVKVFLDDNNQDISLQTYLRKTRADKRVTIRNNSDGILMEFNKKYRFVLSNYNAENGTIEIHPEEVQ